MADALNILLKTSGKFWDNSVTLISNAWFIINETLPHMTVQIQLNTKNQL